MSLDPRPFPTPYLRRHRFHEAVANSGHKVFAVPPGISNEDVPGLPRKLIEYGTPSQDHVCDLDLSTFEVGFPTGSVNGTTVLGVFDEAAQDWLDDLELEITPTVWAPDARYYLFDYAKPDLLALAECPVLGARLFNDGAWIPYPGSWVKGQLVHWEFEPSWFEKVKLSSEFWGGAREGGLAEAVGLDCTPLQP